MENLVVAEHPRRGIGPLQGVCERAHRIQHAAARQQTDAECPLGRVQMRDGKDAHATHGKVDQRSQPLGSAAPQQRDAGSDDGHGAQGGEEHPDIAASEGHQTQRGPGADDEGEDHRVVELAHPRVPGRLPIDAVVQRAGAHAGGNTQGVAQRGPAVGGRARKDEPSTGEQERDERPRMEDSSQRRSFVVAGGSRTHGRPKCAGLGPPAGHGFVAVGLSTGGVVPGLVGSATMRSPSGSLESRGFTG